MEQTFYIQLFFNGALVYKLGRHPFTVEKAERYRHALPLSPIYEGSHKRGYIYNSIGMLFLKYRKKFVNSLPLK